MARGGKKPFKKGKKGKGKKPNAWDETAGKRGNWDEIPKENPKYEAFYKAQGIIPDGEWDQFWNSLKEPLPTTFRVNPNIFAESVLEKLRDFAKDEYTLDDGTIVDPPNTLSWYPEEHGWYFKVGKKELRRSPKMSALHQFVVAQSDNGNITRQEAVSMVPPFFLQVQPGDKVLDMCAAPGSKTAQIVETLHHGLRRDEIPKGFVIANDVDYSRCHILAHQIARLASTAPLVVNHKGQWLPSLKVNGAEIKFDKVLADVPCSGDGAIRKLVDLWPKWNANLGVGMHRLQLPIAIRGAQLVKVGGRFVYSTCSMNPIEDEAVVAEVLRQGKGSLRLIDTSKEMVELKRVPGVTSWKVFDKDGKQLQWDQIQGTNLTDRFKPSMFPPSKEEIEKLELHKCMRFFPHWNDTGGFFVAVFEKVSEFESKQDLAQAPQESQKPQSNEEKVNEGKEEEIEVEPMDSVEVEVPAKRRRGQFEELPYVPVVAKSPEFFTYVKDLFGLREDFPVNQLMTRSEGAPSKVYLLSPDLVPIVGLPNLRVINTGTRVFIKHKKTDSLKQEGLDNMYRLSQEGLPAIFPYITKRLVKVSQDEFITLLTNRDPLLLRFENATQEQLGTFDQGAFVVVVDSECSIKSLRGTPWAAWKGKTSVQLYISAEETRSLKSLLGIAEEKPKGKNQQASKKQAKTDLPQEMRKRGPAPLEGGEEKKVKTEVAPTEEKEQK